MKIFHPHIRIYPTIVKIHTVVDGLGNPIRLIFTSCEIHDSKEDVPLLEGFDITGFSAF